MHRSVSVETKHQNPTRCFRVLHLLTFVLPSEQQKHPSSASQVSTRIEWVVLQATDVMLPLSDDTENWRQKIVSGESCASRAQDRSALLTAMLSFINTSCRSVEEFVPKCHELLYRSSSQDHDMNLIQ